MFLMERMHARGRREKFTRTERLLILSVLRRDSQNIQAFLQRLENLDCDEVARAMLLCARFGFLPELDTLVRAGVDVNAGLMGTGQTVLMEAARSAQPKIVLYLLRHGANIHPASSKLQDIRATALIQAMRFGNGATAKILLEHGADPNLCNGNGESALMYAVLAGDIELVRLLLDADADPDLVSIFDVTALRWAINFGYGEIAELLLMSGASPVHISLLEKVADWLTIRQYRHDTASERACACRLKRAIDCVVNYRYY